jgi:NAD(P)-dependent dehydrogenase (short-subunit alcohol dehydrogenase family)
MKTKTSKQTAIVTGGNRGLGLEICRQLAGLGQRVILTSRDEAKGRAAVQSLKDSGGEILHHPLDVTDPQSITRLRDFVVEKYGKADVLVNNAAILIDPGGHFQEVEAEKFQATLDANLMGPLRLCQAFLPMMLAQNYGRVVNVSSDAGQISGMVDYMPAYRLSKIALNGLTLVLADWVKGTKVLVNAVHPGWVKTDMGGPGAAIGPEESIRGMRQVVAGATPEQSGRFFNYDGAALPW